MNEKLATLIKSIAGSSRRPDFQNILDVLGRRVPSRPTPFEFTLNDAIYTQVVGRAVPNDGDAVAWIPYLVKAFSSLGYDFAVVGGWHTNALVFPMGEKQKKKSKSANDGALITDAHSFEKYEWPELDESRLAPLESIAPDLPEGMQLIVCGPEGVLETTIDLVGFENLCIMLYMAPDLVTEIFFNVGSRILNYYQHIVQFDSVGAIIANDDWGFKTQTMLAPDDLRRLVFPWYKKIAEVAHNVKKPAILHSCGNPLAIIDDIIDDMKIDGKHSFEDTILPVEDAIDSWSDRIAIIGGIDVDFLANRSINEIKKRTRHIRDLSQQKGGIAIGSGNSIPDYIPTDHYCAMLETTVGLD